MNARTLVRELLAVGTPVIVIAVVLSVSTCGGDADPPGPPVGVSLGPILSRSCPYSSYCSEGLSAPHPGPLPGEWYSNIHFPPQNQTILSPSICTEYSFTEVVHFEIEFSTGHYYVDWQYQYLDGNGNLVGTPTVAQQFVLGPTGGSDTANFDVQLDPAANHQFLLVWAVAADEGGDPDEDPCNFSIKLARSGAPPPPPPEPPPPLDVDISGPKYVPQNHLCQWTSIVSGGTGSNSYSWLKDGVQVGTSEDLSTFTGTADFFLRLDVQSGTQSAWDTLTVIPVPGMDDCPSL